MPAAGILGWKRSKYQRPILHNSKSPETPRKSVLEYIKNIGRRKHQRGATPCPRGWGRALPPWACPLPHGPPSRPPMPIFCYMVCFDLEKKSRGSFRDEALPSRGVIRSFCIMLLYRYLLHYGLLFHIMSQYLWLFYLILQGLHKEQILETYSAQLQKS